MSQGCRDPHCPYRALYDGSQLSLAEMTARQAEVYNRLTDLRNAVVMQLKRTFPRLFAAAETQGGQRLSTVSDELLVAYLEAFLGTVQVRPARPEGVEDLRLALAQRGIVIPANLELGEWAQHLATSVPIAPPAAPPAASSTQTAPRSSTPPATPPPVIAHSPETDDLRAFFEDVMHPPAASSDDDPTSVPLDDDWFGGPYDSYDDASADVLADTPDSSPVAAAPPAPPPAVTIAPRVHLTPLRPEMPVVGTPQPARPALPSPTAKAPSPRRPRRTPRARALPPDPVLFDAPAEAPTLDPDGQLSDPVRNALVAATCIPRPVFLADLESVAGSRDLVEAWERECWAQPDSPVGFIPPKSRHRARGSLVIPKDYVRHAAPEFSRSLWASCITNLAGARLYETAVLLHRIGHEVSNWQFSPANRTLSITLAQRRGLVGAIVVLDPDRETLRPALVGEMEIQMTQRPVLVSVLVTHDPSYAMVRSLLVEEADSRQWRPAFPVTMVRSWEFGQPSAPADLVLGD